MYQPRLAASDSEDFQREHGRTEAWAKVGSQGGRVGSDRKNERFGFHPRPEGHFIRATRPPASP